MDQKELQKGLTRLFPRNGGEDIDWQLVAAFAAIRKRLCIISGGPGTGKTRTVVVLLALLLEQHPAMRVALAAPTGKAAARLQEALKHAKATLPCKQAAKDRLPAEASTIHRLLGSIPDSAFFRHDAENPLPFDAVVVDEASMVDLALMAKLVAAIPQSARLILLGDKDQLASVEAGAVLADLCNGGEQHGFSDQFIKEFKALTGQKLPAEAGAGRASDLGDCIVELRKNYRFGDQSGIYRLSRAVNDGDSEKALEVLRESGGSARLTSLLETVAGASSAQGGAETDCAFSLPGLPAGRQSHRSVGRPRQVPHSLRAEERPVWRGKPEPFGRGDPVGGRAD